jgi:chemotaxis protein CheD
VRHVVGVADMRVSPQPGDVIVAYGLGSCLGVAAYDPVARVGGLLHVMMPASTTNPEKARTNPYMFVDTGVPAFLGSLQAAGASRSRCQWKVAGGAMLSSTDYFAIGKKNYIALKNVFWKAGILIDAADVGGSTARTMHVDVGSGRVWLSHGSAERDL